MRCEHWHHNAQGECLTFLFIYGKPSKLHYFPFKCKLCHKIANPLLYTTASKQSETKRPTRTRVRWSSAKWEINDTTLRDFWFSGSLCWMSLPLSSVSVSQDSGMLLTFSGWAAGPAFMGGSCRQRAGFEAPPCGVMGKDRRALELIKFILEKKIQKNQNLVTSVIFVCWIVFSNVFLTWWKDVFLLKVLICGINL